MGYLFLFMHDVDRCVGAVLTMRHCPALVSIPGQQQQQQHQSAPVSVSAISLVLTASITRSRCTLTRRYFTPFSLYLSRRRRRLQSEILFVR